MSIPDDLFERADALARRLGKSRSEIYREALGDYVAARDPNTITARIDDVVADVGREDAPWLAEAGRRALRRSEW